ncbi:MAG: tRNA lysidine(34) synthetase TilS [Myxococcota bacterium]
MLIQSCERALAEVGVRRGGSARVVVACSGGRDSMALLRVAERLVGERAVVAHVDHGRAGSAEVAAELTRFVTGLGLEVHGVRLDPPRDDEATLRDLRHAALERIRRETAARCVLFAHTRDDQAETVLFRVLRARRPQAVTGMARISADRLRVRPWLDVARSEVHDYLAAKGWPHWEDPSNREPRYLRNRLRKELLPLLESRYVPGLARRLSAWASPEPQPSLIMRCVKPEQAPVATATCALFDVGEVSGLRVRSLAPFDLERAGVPQEARGQAPDLVVCDEEGELLWIPGIFRETRALPTAESRDLWVIELSA